MKQSEDEKVKIKYCYGNEEYEENGFLVNVKGTQYLRIRKKIVDDLLNKSDGIASEYSVLLEVIE